MSFFSSPAQWKLLTELPQALPWQDNGMCIVELDGKKLTLARIAHQYYAFAHKCPHASGIMADGYVDAMGQVVCPLHRYRFNVQNGRNTSGEGYYLKTYPVELRAQGLFVQL